MNYHLSIFPDALDNDPDILNVARNVGVSEIWFCGYMFGHRYFDIERLMCLQQLVQSAGMICNIINVPLGHPGDCIQAESDIVPIAPPNTWRKAVRWDGTQYTGTSIHPPAIEENNRFLSDLRALGVSKVFLDDDFRLAVGPGEIGGCFCEEHKLDFFQKFGCGEQDWRELIDSAANRMLTQVMRDWVNYTCDTLTAAFRSQQSAAGDMALGNMIMYLGAEKAGIRLTDYMDVPFRVGEFMFSDEHFASPKAKTDELFSSLFHRRFTSAALAYSETTAFPADKLSARNMAAKLAVPLISDVGNTMYMSGATAFPKEHWNTLGPAMRKTSELYRKLAGHKIQGPFNHYWGEHSRFVGDDNPYSLFLGSGVPFKVTDELSNDGWTFLSDFDARGLSSELALMPSGSVVVSPESGVTGDGIRVVPESLESIFAMRREIMPQLADVPVVLEETPVVCAWYPDINSVLLWNLSEESKVLTLRFMNTHRKITVEGLGVELIEGIG